MEFLKMLVVMVISLYYGSFQISMAEEDVLLPVLRNPKPPRPVKMPKITNAKINDAFKQAKKDTHDRLVMEKGLPNSHGTIPNDEQSATARHQKINHCKKQSNDIGNDQETFQFASQYLINYYKLNSDQARNGLHTIPLSGSLEAQTAVKDCQDMFRVSNCNSASKFRTADGSCNNLDNPIWGRSFTCFERLLPAAYEDGLMTPRVSYDGDDLPGPRTISLQVHNDINVESRTYTHMLMQFAQFLDHDLTVTPMARAGPDMMMIECCNVDDGRAHPECFPIDLPEDDPFFAKFGQFCLNFVRSATCSSDCSLGPRQQTNQLTNFVDGSNIYGSTLEDTRKLRTGSAGLLLSQTSNRVGELLPGSNDPENDQCSQQNPNAICFQAGDERVNEHPGLSAMHTIWLRQHNRIARTFIQKHSRASDEELFQETRRIVGAQLQMIVYGEFLPTVLGPDYMEYFHLTPLQSGYTEYNPNTQPSIVTEFSTAAYRFGHTLIQNKFNSRIRNSGSFDLKDNFFFPFGLYNGELDPILEGLFEQPAQFFERHVVEAVTNHLYKEQEADFGMDLVALNIQRGRDHGVSGYIYYLEYCFNIEIRYWEDLNIVMPEENWRRLANTYDYPADIDLFTGGVSETPLPGGVVGPTFGCIIGMQFHHLKFGDRFYFEHGNQKGSFTSGQLNEIRQKTTLSRIICHNTNVDTLQYHVFLPRGGNNGVGQCRQLNDINYNYWS